MPKYAWNASDFTPRQNLGLRSMKTSRVPLEVPRSITGGWKAVCELFSVDEHRSNGLEGGKLAMGSIILCIWSEPGPIRLRNRSLCGSFSEPSQCNRWVIDRVCAYFLWIFLLESTVDLFNLLTWWLSDNRSLMNEKNNLIELIHW